MRCRNSKGQGMSTNTIVLLILGLIILVALIFGFATGWKGFVKIISPTNVDSVVDDCASVCGLGNQYSYCSGERILRVNEDDLEVTSSCAVLAGLDYFKQRYGIGACPAINCDLTCDTVSLEGKIGKNNVDKADYDWAPITGTACSF